MSRAPAALAFVLALAPLALACQRTPRGGDAKGAASRVELDTARITAELERRAALALARPDVEAQVNALVTSLAEEPRVARHLEALVAALGRDPDLSSAFQEMVGEIGEEPAMQALVIRLLAANPGAPPERVGALVEARIQGVLEGPAFNRGFERGFERLLAEPRVAASSRRLAAAVMGSQALSAGLRDAVDFEAIDRQLGARLVLLNEGETPSRDRATELLLERAITVDRMARLYRDFFALPLVRQEFVTMAERILGSTAFQGAARRRLRLLLADAELRRRAIRIVTAVLEDRPSPAAVEPAIARLLELPVVAEQLAGFIDDLLADPAIARASGDAIARIVAAPAFRDLLTKMLLEV